MQSATPIVKQNGFVIPCGNNDLYNEGNDDIATMRKFAFPAISFSPSFPLSMSLGGPRVPSNSLVPASLSTSVGNVLSPRSAHRPASYCATPGSSAEQQGTTSQWSPSPTPSPIPSTGSSLLSALFSPESPLPPLSPRGVKLANAEKHHQAKCMNRIAEKRRKASDGTQDIAEHTPAPKYVRKVSFDLEAEDEDNTKGKFYTSDAGSTPNKAPTFTLTQFDADTDLDED